MLCVHKGASLGLHSCQEVTNYLSKDFIETVANTILHQNKIIIKEMLIEEIIIPTCILIVLSPVMCD